MVRVKRVVSSPLGRRFCTSTSRGRARLPSPSACSSRAWRKQGRGHHSRRKCDVLVLIRAAVPAARAASAPTPTPAVFAETGALLGRRSGVRPCARRRRRDVRKTNGVPDEPPREMRTCAQARGRRGARRRALFVASLDLGVPQTELPVAYQSLRGQHPTKECSSSISSIVKFSARWPQTRSSRYVAVEANHRRGPGLTHQRPEGDFRPLGTTRAACSLTEIGRTRRERFYIILLLRAEPRQQLEEAEAVRVDRSQTIAVLLDVLVQ